MTRRSAQFRNMSCRQEWRMVLGLETLGAKPLLRDLLEEAFPVRDGEVEIADRPGLGITVREGFLFDRTVR